MYMRNVVAQAPEGQIGTEGVLGYVVQYALRLTLTSCLSVGACLIRGDGAVSRLKGISENADSPHRTGSEHEKTFSRAVYRTRLL